MKNFLKNLFKSSLEVKPVQNASKMLCNHHDTKKLANIIANEQCQTCEIDICYICGTQHMHQHCIVSWKSHSLSINSNTSINQKLQAFNQGYISKLKLDNLKCSCGQKLNLDDDHSAICVACGAINCSIECHQKHQEQTNKCTFHENFDNELKNISMRSILLKNIKFYLDNSMGLGTSVCKTSNAYLKGYLSENSEYIYLQRGYRQYGQPNDELLQNLEVIKDKNLDYRRNENRACDCDCESCNQRGTHSTQNCLLDCYNRKNHIIADMNKELFEQRCDCNCKFCQSGIMISTHTKMDCYLYCDHSQYKEVQHQHGSH